MHCHGHPPSCLQTSGAVRSRSADLRYPGLLGEVLSKRMRRFFRSFAVTRDAVFWAPVSADVPSVNILAGSVLGRLGSALPVVPAWRRGLGQDPSLTFVYMFRPAEVYSGYTFDHLLPDISVEASRVIFAARMAFSSLRIRSLDRYGESALSRERC